MPDSDIAGAFPLVSDFKVSGSPIAVKRGGFRPVDAEINEPAFAGDGFDPLRLFAGRRGWAEVKHELAQATYELNALITQSTAAGVDRAA